ncbi:hypothetical protein J7K93_12390 [bacterium]|nr:hypothetical protein [bacterium]
MGNILKNTEKVQGDKTVQNVKKWDVISKNRENDEGGPFVRRRKIIKAREAVYSSLKKQLPSLHQKSNEPIVSLIRDGDEVKGLEIVCTCGEKIVVDFTFDDHNNG